MRSFLIALFWLAIAATLYFTLRPPTVIVPFSDKAQHAATFGGLIVLGMLAYPRISLLRIVVALSALGALIEIIQPYFGRDRDLKDWIADTAGILLVLAAFGAARLLWRQRGDGQRGSARSSHN